MDEQTLSWALDKLFSQNSSSSKRIEVKFHVLNSMPYFSAAAVVAQLLQD